MSQKNSADEKLSGEIRREPCPIDVCDGDRVTTQSDSLPVGCTTTTCTGECGALNDYEGRRRHGSAMRVKYDVPEVGYQKAAPCPTEGCDETVPAAHACGVMDMPYIAPDDIVEVSFHPCKACEDEFTMGTAKSGDRRVIELEEE